MSARDDRARSVRVLLAFLVGSALFALALCAAAVADTPFKWSAQPVSIDGGTPIFGVSCLPGPTCVAVDGAGNALASTSPSEAAGWTSAKVGVEEPVSKTLYPIDGVSCISATFCAAVDIGSDGILIDPVAKPLSHTPTAIPGTHIRSVSCASVTLCVAVDSAGNVLTSIEPTKPGTWTPANVDQNPHSGNFDNVIWGVSCASESLCVAVDSAGNVLTSTDPASKPAVWTVRSVEGNSIYSVSCASMSLCVAVDAAGNILTSTDPGAESPTWTISPHVDTHPLNAVSCVAPATCVAVDAAGDVVTSTAAAAGAGAWTVTSVDGPRQLYGVSCASLSLCVAVDNEGSVLVGSPAPPQKLSVAVGGAGSGVVTASALEQTTIDCTSFCEPTYPNGTVVTLTAAPTTGSVFAVWTGACRGTGSCTVTLSESREVGATFAVKSSSPGTGASGSSGSGSATQVNPTVAGAIGNLPGEGIAIPMRCWARSGDCLTVRLQLVVVEQLRHHRIVAESAKHKSGLTHRTVVVGSTTVTLAAGRSETVDVRLGATGKKLLAHFRALSALFEIVSKQSGQVIW